VKSPHHGVLQASADAHATRDDAGLVYRVSPDRTKVTTPG
jgi:pyrroloquinoline quinone biosynthesis protein E